MPAFSRSLDTKNLPADTLNWTVLGLCLVAVGYSLYVGWGDLNGQGETPAVVEAVQATPKPSALPELTLNAPHQRQGPEVGSGQPELGRQDPFR